MSNLYRLKATEAVAARSVAKPAAAAAADIGDYGEDVFNEEAMRAYLPKDTCNKLLATINNGAPLDPEIAGDVAQAERTVLRRGSLGVADAPVKAAPPYRQ